MQLLNEEDGDIDNVNWLQSKLEHVELFKSKIQKWFEKDNIEQERLSLNVKSAGGDKSSTRFSTALDSSVMSARLKEV